MADEIIKAEILAAVRSEGEQLESQERSLDDPLGKDSALMEFVEESFNQALHSQLGVGVSGFSQTDKEEALYMIEKVGDEKGGEGRVDDLVRLYIDACNMWPDVLSEAYGGSAADFLEFRTELVPSLLETLRDLAVDEGETDLGKEIEITWTSYAKAIATAGEKIGTDH